MKGQAHARIIQRHPESGNTTHILYAYKDKHTLRHVEQGPLSVWLQWQAHSPCAYRYDKRLNGLMVCVRSEISPHSLTGSDEHRRVCTTRQLRPDTRNVDFPSTTRVQDIS